MARRVAAASGEKGVILPGGWVLDDGDEVVVDDDEWAVIKKDDDLVLQVDDLGSSGDQPTPVPSFRDIQQATLGTGGGGTGDGPDLNYTHTQIALSADWVVTHNLGKHPSVTVVDSGGSEIITNVHYDSLSTVTISFGAATSGKAYLN